MFKMIEERLRETAILVNPLKPANFYFSLCKILYFLFKAEGSTSDGGIHLSYNRVVDECSTIRAAEKEMVEKVINRMVFTKLVHLGKSNQDELDDKVLILNDLSQLKNSSIFST